MNWDSKLIVCVCARAQTRIRAYAHMLGIVPLLIRQALTFTKVKRLISKDR